MDDSPNNHWYPWLKAELEEKGYEVWLPHLPDDKNPQLSVWVPFILNGGKFTEETVIVGHSAGAAVILAVLEELKVKVAQAILVAGFSYYPGGDGILKPAYDWEKIGSTAQEFIIINSDDDPYGHNDVRGRVMFEMLNKPNGGIQVVMKGQGHMTTSSGDMKYKEFPFLLRLIK